MSYPEKVKLTVAGEAVTLQVQKCAKATVGKFPGIEFTGIDQFDKRLITIEVPQSSADRQLGRIPLTYAEAVGCTLTISRDANSTDASKPYWGISLASGKVTARHPNPAEGPPEDDAPHPADRMDPTPLIQKHPGAGTSGPPEPDLYLLLTVATLRDIVPLYVKAGIVPQAADVAAMVATRFIAQTKKY